MFTMRSSIRAWYLHAFPTDEIGPEIDSEATFHDLFDALDTYQNVYKTIGIWDSIVRERCFIQLAAIIGRDYDYIYDQWMKSFA